jgi:PIN domain nuclease of toxin-antitoxin system
LILLDANALIAVLRREPAAAEVAELLRKADCATAASCLSEVVDRLVRRYGVLPKDVIDHLDPLIDASLGIVPIENQIAWQAGELRGVHYARKVTDLSLADCLLLAAAGPDDELATADRALAKVARALEISVIPLPDSKGRRL